MTQQHPITPPDELVQQWWEEADKQLSPYYEYIATQAARWGADQEMEAICKWLVDNHWFMKDGPCVRELRATRRLKPKRQADEALYELQMLCDTNDASLVELDTIRRALERLRELEGGNG